MIFYKIFESIDTLKGAVETLIDNCITGITANREHCKALVESSARLSYRPLSGAWLQKIR